MRLRLRQGLRLGLWGHRSRAGAGAICKGRRLRRIYDVLGLLGREGAVRLQLGSGCYAAPSQLEA